jgi:hypothetical protein
MRKEMWLVYLLIDPRDGIVRYVGSTYQIKTRLGAHRSTALCQNADKSKKRVAWLRELSDLGMSPEVSIIFRTKSHVLAGAVEMAYQQQHRDTITNERIHGHPVKADVAVIHAALIVAIDAMANDLSQLRRSFWRAKQRRLSAPKRRHFENQLAWDAERLDALCDAAKLPRFHRTGKGRKAVA